MPHSHYRPLEVFLGGGTTPRSPHFVRVVHTTGGWPLIGHDFITVNNSRMTVLQTLVTEKRPPLTSTTLGSHQTNIVTVYPSFLANVIAPFILQAVCPTVIGVPQR